MPTIELTNSIGQPTGEIQAQTQKPQIIPVRVSSEGAVSHGQPGQPQTPPQTLEAAVEQQEEQKTPPPRRQDPKAMQEKERMDAIVRRERAMRNQIRESQAREQEAKSQYEAREAAYKAQLAEAEAAKSFRSSLDSDLIGTLTAAGYTTDQITQALINQPGPESQLVKSLSEKIAKMEKAQQDHFKAQQEEANKNYQQALNTIERNVNQLVAKNPEFEVTKASGAQKKVVSYIEKVWKDEGVMLDVEDAAKDVEEYLTEEALKLTKLNKFRPKTPAPAPKAAAPAPQAPQKQTTLTNRMSSQGKPMTARERAIAAFNMNRRKA